MTNLYEYRLLSLHSGATGLQDADAIVGNTDTFEDVQLIHLIDILTIQPIFLLSKRVF